MKFTANAGTLAEHLYRVQGVASAKSTMPALTHVLLRAEGQHLRLAATDLDLAMEDSLPVNIASPGAIAVSAKHLFEVVKALPSSGDVTVVLGEQNRVEVKAHKAQFKLVGVNASEFPAIAAVSTKDQLEVSARELARMIDSTIFCVSTDDARYNLTGIYWEAIRDGSALRFVATDGHRLAVIERDLATHATFKPVIVPKKALIEIKRLLGSNPAEELVVKCGFSDNHAVFTIGEVTLSSRLIEGQFPDYEQVIPKSSPNVVKVAKSELGEALKRVSLMSPDKSFGIRFHASNGNVRIESQNPTLGEAQQEVDVEYEGPDVTIGFNAHYLLDILSQVSEGGVRIELSDHLSPALVRPIEARDFAGIVMPMRV
jgi:DNA polymerase III subunit beta